MTILRPYIYRHTPYRPPPLYQGLGSRVLQGHRDPGSRVTMGHRVTMVTGLIGSQGHWVIGSITRVFSIVRVSMVTMVIGSRVTMGHKSPWSQGYPSPGSQDHPLPITMGLGSWVTMVTGSPWVTGSRVTGSPWVTITMILGHGSPITREIESPITRVTGLPSPWFRVTYNHGLTTGGCCV